MYCAAAGGALGSTSLTGTIFLTSRRNVEFIVRDIVCLYKDPRIMDCDPLGEYSCSSRVYPDVVSLSLMTRKPGKTTAKMQKIYRRHARLARGPQDQGLKSSQGVQLLVECAVHSRQSQGTSKSTLLVQIPVTKSTVCFNKHNKTGTHTHA